MTIPESIEVMDVPIVPFESYEHAIECVEEVIEAGRKESWVAVNPQKSYRAWHDPKLLEILRQADAAICDGIGVSIAAKMLYGQGIRRCTGCDLFFALLEAAARKGWRVFLLGASPESNRGACTRLLDRYPGLKIVGQEDGFFPDSSKVIDRINRSNAEMLFVAMGTPRQEYWIADHRQEIDAAFCMGVGGSFDVASGAARRAPKLFRKTGTEFLYQLLTQPHKRFIRQLMYFPYIVRAAGRAISGASRNGHGDKAKREVI
jgi:N-acetylglucosaminyldiphosphoundecaprenol N-acetyl-beta-D-mannosaminyltransferase